MDTQSSETIHKDVYDNNICMKCFIVLTPDNIHMTGHNDLLLCEKCFTELSMSIQEIHKIFSSHGHHLPGKKKR